MLWGSEWLLTAATRGMFTVVITAERVLQWNTNKSSWAHMGAALQMQDSI